VHSQPYKPFLVEQTEKQTAPQSQACFVGPCFNALFVASTDEIHPRGFMVILNPSLVGFGRNEIGFGSVF
jgi:hypothetical protein